VNGSTENYLKYLGAALSDAKRRAPDTAARGVDITLQELESGQLGKHAQGRLFQLALNTASKEAKRKPQMLWPLHLVVCPVVYALRGEHGHLNSKWPDRVTPVVLYAHLSEHGQLMPDESGALPVFPREYLEPATGEVVIGTLDAADKLMATTESSPESWTALLALAFEQLEQLVHKDQNALLLERYERREAVCLLHRRSSAADAVEELVDEMKGAQQASFPLVDRLWRGAAIESNGVMLLTETQQWDCAFRHLGQMESAYPLSTSQREALLHHLWSMDRAPHEAGAVVAVDGPPGTGKTTLLLSAIASGWVRAALEKRPDPPLVVATSSNNQAVTNVRDAFEKVKADPGPLGGRWLQGITSYGIYMPARSRQSGKTSDAAPPQELVDQGKEAEHPAVRFENEEGLEAARAHFLSCFERAGFGKCTDLAQAVDLLHARIKDQVEIIRDTLGAWRELSAAITSQTADRKSLDRKYADLQQQQVGLAARARDASEHLESVRALRATWKQYIYDEPLWIKLLELLHLGSFRRQRIEIFCAKAEADHPALVAERLRELGERSAVDAVIDLLLRDIQLQSAAMNEKLSVAAASLQNFVRLYAKFTALVPPPAEISAEIVQGALDVGPRFQAFQLATHYWEARYLQQVEQQLETFRSRSGGVSNNRMGDSKAKDKLTRQYLRLAKLYPCFICTLFMLPKRFTGYSGKAQPLFGVIDLLIVDEAGQVSTAIGAPAFALATHALVVGDVDQLAPIPGISANVDCKNAVKLGVVADEAEFETLLDAGRAVSNHSSLMRVAQFATPFCKNPGRGRGLFLSEHRRCLPEIIGICNELVYDGKLVPCRADSPSLPFPRVGYVHIPGFDRVMGESRQNDREARAIADWLRQNRANIEAAFAADGKSFAELVAVVTPFREQANALDTALEAVLGADHGVKIGTAHVLQGAERRMVIFSPTYGLSTTSGAALLDRDPSLLNVAVSRAQDSFLVFGNMQLFRPDGTLRPTSVVGKHLFASEDNELSGIAPELLVPVEDPIAGWELISDTQGHRDVLREAFTVARRRLVIVSPYLSRKALLDDNILELIQRAHGNKVEVRVISDRRFQSKQGRFEECEQELTRAGATVKDVVGQGVHSKLLMVDYKWLVVGSFNWLSAVREAGHRFNRHEASLRYNDTHALRMISKLLREMNVLTGDELPAEAPTDSQTHPEQSRPGLGDP